MDMQGYRSRLQHLLRDYSGRIPNGTVHSTDNNRNYKVRKMWFEGVYDAMSEGIESNFYGEKIVKRFHSLVRYFNKTGFHQRPTRRKDIRMANRMLTLALENLDSELGSREMPEDENFEAALGRAALYMTAGASY